MPTRAQPLLAFGPLGTTRTTVAGVSFDMVKVPPGRFIDGEGLTWRELLVSQPFEIGMTLVTQALWQAVMGSGPSRFYAKDRPVEQVSWDDVQEFLARLSGLGLPGFRLPTEAEWAWAVRCGAPTRWAGVDRAKSVAVVNAGRTALVAGLSPSAAGVFDLSGNLLEWQEDWWTSTPSAGDDVQGPASGSHRVYRGGSWRDPAQNARVANRNLNPPANRGSRLGFRLLRTAP
jgi:formylglycine-generating enzyme required for sulfatase activity